jgi:molybdate-binding protein
MVVIESLANLRSRLFSLPYGDQGLFIKKDSFQKLGGFKDIPLLEDLDLVKRIKQNGALETVDDKIVTSSRRYQRKGAFTTSLTNQFILLAWKAGWSEEKLAELYQK